MTPAFKKSLRILWAIGLPAVAGFTLPSCGEGTGGRRVTLQTQVAAELPADNSFTTGLGWMVTLEKAVISTGPFYYYDGKPAFTTASLTPPRNRLRRWLGALSPIGAAHAHPGHYGAGNMKGEMTTAFSLDLLAGPTSLPAGEGTTGLVRSGTFSYAAPTAGPAVDSLQNHAVLTQGRATKDGATVYFVLAADVSEVATKAKDAHVSGCAFAETTIDGDGVVTATITPRVWFNLVDFARIARGTADAPTIVEATAVPRIGFVLGLAQSSAYHFAFSPGDRP